MKKTALEINDRPRELPPGSSASVPLVTLAWRALRAEHERRRDEVKKSDAETKKLQNALIGVAEHTAHLRLAGAGQGPFDKIARQLESVLGEAGIAFLAPSGEPFEGDLMELFDNVAQRTEAGITGPYIAEVVKPAVLRNGALLRMGKAIIAVPARDDGAASE
jgi:molecular chaperone GrpE (heat shock protein)